MQRISTPTRLFHWLSALLFLFVFCIGFSADWLDGSDLKRPLMNAHKSVALIVLGLAILRLIWRIKEGKITPTRPLPRWQQVTSTALHHTLLLITLVMPVSGIFMSLGGGRDIGFFGATIITGGEKIQWMQSVGSWLHHSLPNLILAMLIVHVLAAIKHEYIDKDGTLSRMLGR
ncbi:MAG: cytochrome b [Vibrio sp.]